MLLGINSMKLRSVSCAKESMDTSSFSLCLDHDTPSQTEAMRSTEPELIQKRADLDQDSATAQYSLEASHTSFS
jgi:hypothetical protein